MNKKVSSFGFQVFKNQKPQTKNPKPIKKIIINQCKSASNKNINRWNIHDYIKTHKGMIILAVKVKWWDWKKIEMIDKKRLKKVGTLSILSIFFNLHQS